jgi:hypothetical protein
MDDYMSRLQGCGKAVKDIVPWHLIDTALSRTSPQIIAGEAEGGGVGAEAEEDE